MPPRVTPVSTEALEPELAAAIARGVRSRLLSSALPVRIWAHRPKVALAWLQALEEIHERGVLPARLRELVRLRIAAANDCPPCRIARKSDEVDEADVACLAGSDETRFSAGERAAIRFAARFATEPAGVDDQDFDELGRWYTVEQIVELNLYCALMLAGGRMALVQRAYEDQNGGGQS